MANNESLKRKKYPYTIRETYREVFGEDELSDLELYKAAKHNGHSLYVHLMEDDNLREGNPFVWNSIIEGRNVTLIDYDLKQYRMSDIDVLGKTVQFVSLVENEENSIDAYTIDITWDSNKQATIEVIRSHHQLEKTENKVTSWSSELSDTKYPSEKLVKTTIDAKQPTIPDIEQIRQGAAKGATSIQPEDMVAYRKSVDQDVIDNEIKTIALGATQAKSVAGYAELTTLLNGAAKNKFNIGQNFYVKTLGVPDVWVSDKKSTQVSYNYTTDEQFVADLETTGFLQLGFYEISKLETSKVDLSDYRKSVDQDAIDNTKVDKVEGKGLSTNDYTTTEKAKLGLFPNGIGTNGQVLKTDVSGNIVWDEESVRSVNNTFPVNGNITVNTFLELPREGVVRDGTTLEFCNSVANLSSSVPGTAYLGADCMLTDMPFSGNAEIIVYVIANHLLVLELSSMNAFDDNGNAGKWTAMYWSGSMRMMWKGIMHCPKDSTTGEYIPSVNSDGVSKYYFDTVLSTTYRTSEAQDAIDDTKVDKIVGKGLSTNDYTTAEKTKLAGVAEGATANIGTITEVKMNGASKGTSGVVDLGTVLTTHQDITGKQDKSDLVTVVNSSSTDTTYPSAKAVETKVEGTRIDLMTEINKKQNTLIGSGTGQNIKTVNNFELTGSGNVDIVANRAFKASWNAGSNLPIETFLGNLESDADTVPGSTWIGGVKCNNLPAGLGNCECSVQVFNSTLGGKVLLVDLYSTSTNPYHWTAVKYNATLTPWIDPGQKNIIETVKVDGTALTPDANKAVNIVLSGKENVSNRSTQITSASTDDQYSSSKSVYTFVNTEVAKKQDTLIGEMGATGQNIKSVNGSSLVGSGNVNIITNRAFKENWPTDTTWDALCTAINNDADAVPGTTWLGGVSCTPLPGGLGNGECCIQVINSSISSSKVLHIDLYSSNVSPYHWTAVYFGSLTPWMAEGGTGEVNVIETVKVDGTPLTVTNKAVNIDLSGKFNTSSAGSLTDLATSTKSTLVGAINEVNTVAKGGQKGVSFLNYQAMITDLNGKTTSEAYNIGQSIYIKTLEVPDVWISDTYVSPVTYEYTSDEDFIAALKLGTVKVGYFGVNMLETAKVDLTGFRTKTDQDTIDNAIKADVTALQNTRELTANKVTALTSSSTDTEYPSAKVVFDFVTGSSMTVLSKTYSELGALISSGSLSPGRYYRITDYVCTTTTSSTSSAGNRFDILVQALNSNKLSNNALATWHDGDTYFSSSRLDCWQLKYSFANTTSLFQWADSVNGKGVIYYMKDEYGNEAPYDFKNIKFAKDGLTSYTFSSADGNTDLSLTGNHHNNILGEWVDNGQHKLNFNRFIGVGCFYNVIPEGGNNNTFGSNCESNKFGLMCSNNTFGSYCHHNTFGNNCYRFTVGKDFRYANVGNDSHDITFVDSSNNLLTYVYNVEIGEAVHWVKFIGPEVTRDPITYEYKKLQNLNIAMGIEGADGNPLAITLTVPRNAKYTWNVAYDSSNNIKQWCDANDELVTNKTTSITSASTHDQYPSAKAVYDLIVTTLNTPV